MMNAKKFEKFCKDKNASKEALEAIKGMTLREWWDSTDRADWMVWLMGRTGQFDKMMYIRLAIYFAESVLHLVRDKDKATCGAAIQAAKDYLANPTEENRKKASSVAAVAASASFAAAISVFFPFTAADFFAASASFAASFAAARAAYAVAASAYAEAYAAEAASFGAAHYAGAAETVQQQNADYVRTRASYEDILQAITAQTGKEGER